MNSTNKINLNTKETLIHDDNPIWQNLLKSPRINELFDGIRQAEKDIKSGETGKDFDKFFEEFNKEHLNGTLFQSNNP